MVKGEGGGGLDMMMFGRGDDVCVCERRERLIQCREYSTFGLSNWRYRSSRSKRRI